MPGIGTVRIPLGCDAKMYIGNTEVSTIQSITLNLEKGEADVTTRGSGGRKEVLPTNEEASIEFSLVWDTTDASFSQIANAFLFNQILEFRFLDGSYVANTSGTGLHAWCGIFKFSREEQLDGALIANCTVKPTYAGGDAQYKPKWIVNGAEAINPDDSE